MILQVGKKIFLRRERRRCGDVAGPGRMTGWCACRSLKIAVGTGLIAVEWVQYVTPCIRGSTCLSALWFCACALALAPLAVLYGGVVLLPELVLAWGVLGCFGGRRGTNPSSGDESAQ